MFYMTCVAVSGMQSEPTSARWVKLLFLQPTRCRYVVLASSEQDFAVLLSPQSLHSDLAVLELHNNT